MPRCGIEKNRVQVSARAGPGYKSSVASFEIDQNKVIKYRFWSKTDGLEKAMKHLGLYERDNDQKTNPLRGLLDSLSCVAVKVSNGKSRRKQ